MTYVFKNGGGDYLIADDQLPITCLPFEEEDLRYVCILGKCVADIVGTPETSYEMGSGFIKYKFSLAHITPDQFRRAVERDINDAEGRLNRIKSFPKREPGLQFEIDSLEEFLGQLKQSIS